MTLWTTKINF